MRFEEIAGVCEEVSEKDSRNEKIAIISNFLRGVDEDLKLVSWFISVYLAFVCLGVRSPANKGCDFPIEGV